MRDHDRPLGRRFQVRRRDLHDYQHLSRQWSQYPPAAIQRPHGGPGQDRAFGADAERQFQGRLQGLRRHGGRQPVEVDVHGRLGLNAQHGFAVADRADAREAGEADGPDGDGGATSRSRSPGPTRATPASPGTRSSGRRAARPGGAGRRHPEQRAGRDERHLLHGDRPHERHGVPVPHPRGERRRRGSAVRRGGAGDAGGGHHPRRRLVRHADGGPCKRRRRLRVPGPARLHDPFRPLAKLLHPWRQDLHVHQPLSLRPRRRGRRPAQPRVQRPHGGPGQGRPVGADADGHRGRDRHGPQGLRGHDERRRIAVERVQRREVGRRRHGDAVADRHGHRHRHAAVGREQAGGQRPPGAGAAHGSVQVGRGAEVHDRAPPGRLPADARGHRGQGRGRLPRRNTR